MKHYSVGDTISGGILEDREAVITEIERLSATRDRVHYTLTVAVFGGCVLRVRGDFPGTVGSFLHVYEDDQSHVFFEKEHPDVLSSPRLNALIAAKVFAESIGKRVRGSGYPGATIAGPPKEDPDGKLCVPLYTSDSEPDWIPIENLTIESE